MFPNPPILGPGYASLSKSHAPAPVPPYGEMWVLEIVMATVRKSENQSRIAAINNARDAILERAEKDSERMMKGLLANPELTFALKSFEQILAILLKKGHKDDLVKLSQDHRVGKLQKSQIRVALAAAGFEAVCEQLQAGNDAAAVQAATAHVNHMSDARLRAEMEWQQLCRA
jgi:hypothetical protein